MAQKLVTSDHLLDKLSQTSIDAMFPSAITLLPPDIARQIELDSQKAPAAGDDRYVTLLMGLLTYMIQLLKLITNHTFCKFVKRSLRRAF